VTVELVTTPLIDRPIVPDASEPGEPRNVNGPCLIRVPAWAEGALGRYYLYYASHKGARIELAHADQLAGPWTRYEPGALQLCDTPFLQAPPAIPESIDRAALGTPRGPGIPSPLEDATVPHIASPDVVVDETTRTFRLYYHGLDSFGIQNTRVAVSSDGLHFESPAEASEVVAPPYLRVFRHAGFWYGLAMPGHLVRSRDGIRDFERGPTLFGPDMRHAGLWLRDRELWVFWTRVGDVPERILLSTIDVSGSWRDWRESVPLEVRRPLRPWEGADEPLEPSRRSAVDRPVHQLRDPYLFAQAGDAYLVYAVAGESGLAIARLELR
jgi:hypothetical protein